jgi:hypothetical protein
VPDTFPNLRSDRELVLACDYAGEHKASAFQVLAFLLADRPGVMRSWEEERLRIRKKHLADGRRLSFKDLSDARRQKALGPFLRASAGINGILLCVAVEKSLAESTLGYRMDGFDDIKPRVLAKLVKISLLGSLLVGGLSGSGQNLLWITDDDEIVSNERTQAAASAVAGTMLKRFCPQGFGDIHLGIAGKFDDGRRAEDLCAIPDLAGGAVAETMTAFQDSIPESAALFTPLTTRPTTKTEIIHSWLATLRGPLRHLLCALRPADDGGVRWSFGNSAVQPGIASRLWQPPDKGWRKSIQSW